MVRVTVKPYLQPYLQQLAESWGVADPTELVNQIIFEHRKAALPAIPSAVPPTQPKNELDELSDLL